MKKNGLTFLGIGVALVLLVYVSQSYNLKPIGGPATAQRNTSTPLEVGTTGVTQPSVPREEVLPPRDTSAEELAAAMSRVEAALGQCDLCKSKLDQLATLVADWNSLTKDIESNEIGKRIAATPLSVRSYLEVMKPTHPYAQDTQITRFRERLRLLQAIPTEARTKQDRRYSPVKNWSEAIAQLDADVQKDIANLENGLGLLKSLLDSNTTVQANTPTLAMAIAAEKKKLNDEKLSLIQNKEAEAIKVGNEQVAEARKRAVETEKKLEAKKALDEATAKVEAEKKEKLRLKAKSDETKKYLGHFFVESYYQPIGFERKMWLRLNRTEVKGPMSYSKMVGLGALDDGMPGLSVVNLLSGAHGTYNIDNYERPLIKAPHDPNRWSNTHFEFLQKAQALLKELGPILVEEGLLSK